MSGLRGCATAQQNSSHPDGQTDRYQGSHFFLNTKFQVFSRFLVLNSRFFHVFLCQIPGTCTFKQILIIKISKCVKTDRVPTSLVTQNSRYFPSKCNEIPGQFGFESVFVLIMQISQRCKSSFFWKSHLEKWILKNKIYKVQVFFQVLS